MSYIMNMLQITRKMRNKCKVWIRFPNGLRSCQREKEHHDDQSKKPRSPVTKFCRMFLKCLIYSRVRVMLQMARAPGCSLREFKKIKFLLVLKIEQVTQSC